MTRVNLPPSEPAWIPSDLSEQGKNSKVASAQKKIAALSLSIFLVFGSLFLSSPSKPELKPLEKKASGLCLDSLCLTNSLKTGLKSLKKRAPEVAPYLRSHPLPLTLTLIFLALCPFQIFYNIQ